MNKNDFFYLGKILKTHGNRGHLLVILDMEDPSVLTGQEAIFIGIGHDFIPFIIEDLDIKDLNKVILKFEDVNSVSDAESYSGMSLYLPVSSMPGVSEKEVSNLEITGFMVIDEKHGNIGTLTSVIDMPHQKLLRVDFREKEILIPLVKEILVRTDYKKKILHVKIPDGLLEIYL